MLCVYVNVNVNGMLREKIGGEWRGGEIGLENKYTITDSSHPQGNADRGRILGWLRISHPNTPWSVLIAFY